MSTTNHLHGTFQHLTMQDLTFRPAIGRHQCVAIAMVVLAIPTLFREVPVCLLDSAGATELVDTFDDGQIDDNDPISWTLQGNGDVIGGDLILDGLGPNLLRVVAEVDDSAGWSIRSQVRLVEGEFVAVQARSTPPGSGSGGWALFTELGTVHVGFGSSSLASGQSDLVPVGEDVMLQLDTFDDMLRASAWPVGEPRPSEPVAMIDHPTGLSRPALYARSAQDGRPTEAIFRYVEASSTKSIVESSLPSPLQLEPGDADQDLDFDQLDLVRVLSAGKYLTAEPATWGEGDWNSAPGGSQGDPPAGNGFFDQLDIIVALNSGAYLTGRYGALKSGQSLVEYREANDMPFAKMEPSNATVSSQDELISDLTYDVDDAIIDTAAKDAFRSTVGVSIEQVSIDDVTQSNLDANGSLAGLSMAASLSGSLEDLDLIYIPEPSSVVMLFLGAIGILALVLRPSRFTIG